MVTSWAVVVPLAVVPRTTIVSPALMSDVVPVTVLVMAVPDGTVTVWDVGSGEPLLTFDGHDGAVAGVAWSADGKRLASSAMDGTSR